MREKTNRFEKLPLVCIQGLGFVGSAMAIAVANALKEDGSPYFNVLGIDLPTEEGKKRVKSINSGKLYFKSLDDDLKAAFEKAWQRGNLSATMDPADYGKASIVVVDIQLDIEDMDTEPHIDFSGFKSAIQTLGMRLKAGALIVVETTVPPGTCEKIILPEIDYCLESRSMEKGSILIAHSYERVMPGKDYYNSIINFWRVYSGINTRAADSCESFLSKVINVDDYPLTRLQSTTATETAKVLENSYRSVNIAFIEEWARFAESVGIDLFEVIDAIRMRSTHSNIRQPGFGVGGYCLTKDPLFAPIAAKTLLNADTTQFDFSESAVRINRKMPMVTLNSVQKFLGGTLEEKSILLLGVSYRPDVADTRNSPSFIFYEHAKKRGANIQCHDPLVDYWPEMDFSVAKELPCPKDFDVLVFAVAHSMYRELNLEKWLDGAETCIFDANRVMTAEQISFLSRIGHRFMSIGRGIK
jgi:UDP-N-acetyl-D-glucosamine dehydrogenase